MKTRKEELMQELGEMLYKLNKETKQMRPSPERYHLYTIKTKILSKYAQNTAIIHKFSKGGYGELLKLGKEFFHTMIDSKKIESPIMYKIIDSYTKKYPQLSIDPRYLDLRHGDYNYRVEIDYKSQFNSIKMNYQYYIEHILPSIILKNKKENKKIVIDYTLTKIEFISKWTELEKKEAIKIISNLKKEKDKENALCYKVETEIDSLFKKTIDKKFKVVTPPRVSEKGRLTQQELFKLEELAGEDHMNLSKYLPND